MTKASINNRLHLGKIARCFPKRAYKNFVFRCHPNEGQLSDQGHATVFFRYIEEPMLSFADPNLGMANFEIQ